MAMAKTVNGVFIVAAKRTAFGTFGGKLKNMSATDLGVVSSKAAMEQANLKPEDIKSVVIGNVITSAVDGIYGPRHIALQMGIPQAVPCLGLNRLCGTGFQAIVTAAQEIELGLADVVLAGGIENMTQVPYAVRNIRFGTKFGDDLRLQDMLWEGLTDTHVKLPMGMTAENLADQYGLTREDCDRYAVQSQERWQKANAAGVFKDEIAPITLKSRKGPVQFDTDEHPRAASLEQMAKLPPVFKKNGTVTAANASGIVDGACSLILASEAAVNRLGLTPLARLSAYGISGCDPKIMGIGPVPMGSACIGGGQGITVLLENC